MNRVWRAIIGVTLVGVISAWGPGLASSSIRGLDPTSSIAYADHNDNDGHDCEVNTRKSKKCHWNGWDNDNDVTVTNEPGIQGIPNSAGGITVSMARTTETPALNQVVQLMIRGEGAPMVQLDFWAEGPTGPNPQDGDPTALGLISSGCNQGNTCDWVLSVIPRNSGTYVLHARAISAGGAAVQTNWVFTV